MNVRTRVQIELILLMFFLYFSVMRNHVFATFQCKQFQVFIGWQQILIMVKRLQLSYKRPTTTERYQKLKDHEKKKKTINNDGLAAVVSYTSRKDKKTIQEEIQELIFLKHENVIMHRGMQKALKTQPVNIQTICYTYI